MYSLGAIPSTQDARDYAYPLIHVRTIVPPTLDLRNSLTGVRDQGQQGTCVAQAGACCKEYQEKREIGFNEYLSPQFVYNNRINYPGVGMSGRDLMRILRDLGIAQEANFVYGNQTIRDAIPDVARQDALNFRIKSYAQIEFKYNANGTPAYSNNIEAVKLALVENGPTVIILPCYNYGPRFWYRPDAGAILIGWHAVALVGYNASGFIVRNSWGTGWENRGYCEMSYSDFNLKPMSEHWTMTDDKSNMVVPARPGCKCSIM